MFEEHIRSLAFDGAPLGAESFKRVWEELRRVLRQELRRRGVIAASPAYLGVLGYSSWDAEALDDLVSDVYVHIFVERLKGLSAHLKVRESVDGLVRTMVRHYLHDRQKRADPLGYRLYSILRSAIEVLIDDQRLHVASGSIRIDNQTILKFDDASPLYSPPSEGDLNDFVSVLAHTHSRELIAAQTKEVSTLISRLATDICDLRSYGVDAFLFGHLVKGVKTRVRNILGSMFERDEVAEEDVDGITRRVPITIPDNSFESAQYVEALSACISKKIEAIDKQQRTRNHLEKMWAYIRVIMTEGDHLPSSAKMGQLLGIPRARIPELLQTIGGFLQECVIATKGDGCDRLSSP